MSPVDLALVLVLDASASVTFEEFNLIAGGLARAFRDGQVIAGLTGGPLHASQAAVLGFSGASAQAVLVNWARIGSAKEAHAFADAIDNAPRMVQPGLTAIGEALVAALDLLGQAPAQSRRQIVDVAGDGRSNDGIAPGPVRDRMAGAGITVNGLCVLHEEPDLESYYASEVIGGPGAFTLTCPDYAAFAEAMRRKLVREAETEPIA
jgi:Mg-chelatase subunit ChlD